MSLHGADSAPDSTIRHTKTVPANIDTGTDAHRASYFIAGLLPITSSVSIGVSKNDHLEANDNRYYRKEDNVRMTLI
jgi:hypothetical protein